MMDVETGEQSRQKKHTILHRWCGPKLILAALAVLTILLAFLCASLIHLGLSRTLQKSLSKNAVSVVSVELIDTSTNAKVTDLTDGLIVNLDHFNLPITTNFTIEAKLSNDKGSIVFGYNDIQAYSIAESAPFIICGKLSNSNYAPCPEFSLGTTHQVTITPYVGNEQDENMGKPIQISFTIINDAMASAQPLVSASGGEITANVVTLQNRTCNVPKFDGEWEWGSFEYPVSVAEAQGGRIGDNLVVIGGFKDGYKKTTTETFSLSMVKPESGWQRLDDMPVYLGITHGAFAMVKETTMVMCGGYVGGGLGLATDVCLQLDTAQPQDQQWSRFTRLPEGRAGGGMMYDSKHKQLVYSGGAQRPTAGVGIAIDFNNTWIYDFEQPADGWTETTPLPFQGNHMSFVTAKDNLGRERHFILGGQEAENEHNGNTKEVYEWDVESRQWIEHPDMPFTRGHAASATRAISCGFIVAGGTSNEIGMLSDISYYDIPSKNWTKVGELPSAVNTAVCDFGGGYLYCETGWATGKYSARRKIVA